MLLCVVPFLISSFGLPLAPHFLLCGGMAFQWVILFLICFAALGFFTLYLSRNIDYGEARFDSDGNVIRDEENKDE